MDHVFFRGRRKEGALMIQLNASWRLKRLGWSHILSNKDMTNAFASSTWPALREANKVLLEEEDQILGAQRFEEATVDLETADGKGVSLKTKVGGLIGDPWAVYSFCQAFHRPVSRWQMSQRLNDFFYDALYAKDPVTEETVDLSLTKYADDLVKIITAGAQGSVVDLAEAAWESKKKGC